MLERIFSAEEDLLPDVIEMVEEELERVDCPMEAMIQISVATEEIFLNIAHYAYPEGEGEMALRMDADEQQVELQFIDEGFPFDPLGHKDPDVEKQSEDESVGGLGILMVKKTMDDVRYKRADEKNVLTIIKKIG